SRSVSPGASRRTSGPRSSSASPSAWSTCSTRSAAPCRFSAPAKPTLATRTAKSTSARPEFRGRVVFLSDYDMGLARALVAGCDVWLNTPERPREASGTSGMKAAMNGALNLSVLDGWWDEAPHDEAGFVVGDATDH